MHIYERWILYIYIYGSMLKWRPNSVNVHLRKVVFIYFHFHIYKFMEVINFQMRIYGIWSYTKATYVYVHIQKHAYTEANFHKCTYIKAFFLKCAFKKAFFHICAFIEVASLHKCAFMEVGFFLCIYTEACIYISQFSYMSIYERHLPYMRIYGSWIFYMHTSIYVQFWKWSPSVNERRYRIQLL